MAPCVYFLYASQTGTAETIAKQLHNRAITEQRSNLSDAVVMTLNDFEKLGVLANQEETSPFLTLVIVVSTTGDGEIPDSGAKFKRWLRNTDVASFPKTRFTMLALGDTNYNSFCAAGRHVDAKLEDKGARRFYARGEADDAFGLDSVVDPWCEGLWAALDNLDSAASKTMFKLEGIPDTIHVPLNIPRQVLILYDMESPVLRRLALMLYERVIEFGGLIDLHPLSCATVEELRKKDPEVILLLMSSAPRDASSSVSIANFISSGGKSEELSALGAWSAWLSSSRVISHAFLGLATSVEEQEVLKTIHQRFVTTMTTCRKGAAVELNSKSSLGTESLSASNVVTNNDGLFTWCQVVMDHLPGVDADVCDITTALNKHFPFVTASTASSNTSRSEANRRGGKQQFRSVGDGAGKSPHRMDRLVHSVLAPLVLLYTNEDSRAVTIAYDLQQQAAARGIDAVIAELSNFKSVGFPRRGFFVFVLGSSASVIGMPKSVLKVIKAVKLLDVSQPFEGVKFGILGIDDRSTATTFNAAALELECALLALDAKKCQPTALADCSDDVLFNTVLANWHESLWGSIATPIESAAYIDGGVLAAATAVTASSPATEAAGGSGGTFSWFPWQPLQLRKESLENITVELLYSNSGMAKTLALQAQREAHELGISTLAMSFNRAAANPADTCRSRCIVLFVEAAADGVTMCGGRRWKHFLASPGNPPDLLSHMHFAVLGLGGGSSSGSSTSEVFGAGSHGDRKHPASRLSERMSALQANRVFPVAFIRHLSQLHSAGIPWFRGVLSALSNLITSGPPAMGNDAWPPTPSFKPSSASVVLQGDNEPAMFQPSSKMVGGGVSALFLYGSVTGNSESIARDLHSQALQCGFTSRVAPLNHFEKMKFLSTSVVVIVCCTTCSPQGESGHFPTNAKKFLHYIRKRKHPSDLLSSLRYAVLAIGSTRYASTFCVAGKEIDSRLSQLGGQRVCDVGLADEMKGLDAVVEPWRQALFAKLVAGARAAAVAATAGVQKSPESMSRGLDGVAPLDFLALPDATPLGHTQGGLSIVSDAASENQKVLIMFGSQKGNAEVIAQHIYAELCERTEGYDVQIASLNEFESKHWRKYPTVIIVCSTTGEGEFPDNAYNFYRFLRKSHPEDLLSGMKFAVLGLGDTNYSRFCQAAKTLDRRLEELGASRFYARGEADDAFGLDSVVEPWINNLWTALQTTKRFQGAGTGGHTTRGETPSASGAPEGKAGSETGVGLGASQSSGTTADRLLRKSSSHSRSSLTAKIQAWRRLTPETSDNAVILLDLEVPDSVSWLPGDAIAILPENDPDEVDEILTRLGVCGEDPFLPPTAPHVSSLFPGSPIYARISYPITNRDVLTHLVSLRIHKASKQIFSVFLLSTRDPAEQALLSSWMPAGTPKPAPAELRSAEKLTLLDVLRKFENARPPFRHVVEYLMVLQPRPYSICSAKIANPTKLSICFKVVPMGLCTNWLLRQCERASAVPNAAVEIPIIFRESPEFRLPQDLQMPLILVGPGTGVAPFISFLQHRRALALQAGVLPGEVQLFFGCRTSANDFILKSELDSFVNDKTIKTLHVAFSQESNPGFFWYGGCYVQDKMQECSQYLCELMVRRNAHVYVCGDAESMARDVHRVLIDIVEQHQQCTTTEATQFIQKLSEEGRYQRDIWTTSQ